MQPSFGGVDFRMLLSDGREQIRILSFSVGVFSILVPISKVELQQHSFLLSEAEHNVLIIEYESHCMTHYTVLLIPHQLTLSSAIFSFTIAWISSLKKQNALCEARTHDLQIMRLTR